MPDEKASKGTPTTTMDPHQMTEDQKFALARTYFDTHPEEQKWRGKTNGLGTSYYKTAGNSIFKITSKRQMPIIGNGAYGRIKHSEPDQTVVKICETEDPKVLAKFITESQIAIDLNLANSDILIREKQIGHKKLTKTYQRMYYKGINLHHIIREERTKALAQPARYSPRLLQDREIARSIDLCILVNQLHTGQLSKTGTCYTHRDIKPANITIDSSGKMHLVDLGACVPTTAGYSYLNGTSPYFPVDIEHTNTKFGYLRGAMLLESQHGETYASKDFEVANALQDKIATLRTISHPFDTKDDLTDNDTPSILSASTKANLPPCLADLLDTKRITPHLTEERIHETEKFFAAVLIQYKNNDYHITPAEINRLRHDERMQDLLIQRYLLSTPHQTEQQTLKKTMSDLRDKPSDDHQTKPK